LNLADVFASRVVSPAVAYLDLLFEFSSASLLETQRVMKMHASIWAFSKNAMVEV